jgi:hypothetical protein
MGRVLRTGIVLFLAMVALHPPAMGQNAQPLTPAQIDQLTAPIALYPDPLLAQILMAATYPLEITKAGHWAKIPANAALKDDRLIEALLRQPWDPSVKSLVAVPPILQMLDGDIRWTVQLGDAFLAAQPAVMDSVQRLRKQAATAGKLSTTPQMPVTVTDSVIVLTATDPANAYIPVYHPKDVYGAWPNPAYPPDDIPAHFANAEIGPSGFGWFKADILGAFWNWDSVDWAAHSVKINMGWFNAMNRDHPAPKSDMWQHDPSHRRGVPYRDAAVRVRFQGMNTPDQASSLKIGSSVAPSLPQPGAIVQLPEPAPRVGQIRPEVEPMINFRSAPGVPLVGPGPLYQPIAPPHADRR